MPCPGGECVMGENGESTCVCRVGQFFDESAAACTGAFSVCIMCAYLYNCSVLSRNGFLEEKVVGESAS